MSATVVTPSFAADKIVIAHRGASGYVPEHTIASKAMAYAMGADYLEQDLVMTKDDHVVVLHDHHLDQVTNVQEVYPARKREDGRYYVIDFTLAEIRQLTVSERYYINGDSKKAVFQDRFPLGKSRFYVHTFEEEIELVQGLNKSTGKNVGIYPEIKSPQFHLDEGKDISKKVIQTLQRYGYDKKSDKAFLQTFDYTDLKRIKTTLFPELGVDVNLVQLMGNSKEYQWMTSADGMATVAQFADGIGPDMSMIVGPKSKLGAPQITELVDHAHRNKLVVHPYTFRADAIALPSYVEDFDQLLDLFFNTVGIDGVFTDFTDKAVNFLNQ